MRQFSLRREVLVPWGQRLPPNVHGYTRKGVPATTSWADRMLLWVEGWLHALEDVVQDDAPCNPGTYEEYIEWYSNQTRVRCIRFMDDPPRHKASTTDTYSTQLDSALHRVVDVQWEMHDLVTSVRHMAL